MTRVLLCFFAMTTLLGAFQALANSGNTVRSVEPGCAKLIVERWSTLRDEAQRLVRHRPDAGARLPANVTERLRDVLSQLQGLLQWGVSHASRGHQLFVGVALGVDEVAASPVKIGLGLPGLSGCSNPLGSKVLWSVFTDKEHGMINSLHWQLSVLLRTFGKERKTV
jgi:hypothetical protein